MSAILKLRRLELSYADEQESVLKDFSLSMEPGELLCILGPSGCGKSTLLRAVAGLMTIRSGSIDYQPLRGESEANYDRILVLQREDQLFPWLTVAENVGMPLKRLGRRRWREESSIFLKLAQIHAAGELYPHQLSGGMRQRAVLARALSADPELLLLDEPFAHLDSVVRGALQELLTGIWTRREQSIIFVTHDIQEAIVLASRIIVLDHTGTIVEDRPIDLPRPRDPFAPDNAALVRELRELLRPAGRSE